MCRRNGDHDAAAGLQLITHWHCAAGDPEYEPQASDMPPEPRRFRNPEMPAQARVEKPTKAEKCERTFGMLLHSLPCTSLLGLSKACARAMPG